jgi:hypothetical protein
MLNSQRVNILIYGPSSISCKPRFFATLSISESWRISPERPGSILADWRCSGTSKNADLAGFSTAWWLTYPSEKYQFVSWDYEIPNIYILWKIKTCSKPATSLWISIEETSFGNWIQQSFHWFDVHVSGWWQVSCCFSPGDSGAVRLQRTIYPLVNIQTTMENHHF